MSPETPSMSPLGISAMRAMRLKQIASQRASKTAKSMIVHQETVEHANGEHVNIMREIDADESLYSVEMLREIRRKNGSGKGLRRLAEKQANRVIGQPSWMRPATPKPEAA